MHCLLIQLSDLHIKQDESEFWTAERARLVARSATRNGPYKMVIIVVSGDIAYAGRNEEYRLAEDFFSELLIECESLSGCNAKLVLAPGNHDCDFSHSSSLRNYARTQISEESIRDKELLEKLSEPLTNYRRFEARTETFNFTEQTDIVKVGDLGYDDFRIQLRVWNSPLYSALKEGKGQLYLPPTSFEQGWSENCLRLAVMHHPPSWFADSISREIRTALRTHAHVVLYGHEHEPEVGQLTTFRSQRSNDVIEIDGAVMHSHGANPDSSFITLEIDGETQEIKAWLHTWDEAIKAYGCSELTDSTRQEGWINLPRTNSKFVVGHHFEERIKDPGIKIVSNNGRAVVARDLFVFPELAENLRDTSKMETIVSAEFLLDIQQIQNGLVIQGDEKTGKTALLLRLFSDYRESGYIPLYIGLREHKIKREDDLRKAFTRAISAVYPAESEDSIHALSKESRIYLVDDIDSLTKPELRTELIHLLKSRCHAFVCTTTMKTKMAEVLTSDITAAVSQIRQMRWVKMSHQKRFQLISRWVKVVENQEDAEDIIQRVDYLEKAAAAALGHNLVPRVPHMLIIFLHSSSSMSQTKLEKGSLANYYSFLVTGQLLSAGIKPDEIEEFISFARSISYFMHRVDRSYISREELDSCNAEFSEEFFPGSITARLNVLRHAKLLTEYGSDAFQWRHSYFQYLFLGEYLGSNSEKEDVATAILHMCKHLYVRANANALLFLVHFSKSSFVFSSLTQAINGLFENQKPLQLGVDTKEFSELVKDARNIVLPKDMDTLKEREKRNQRRDAFEEHSGDGLQDTEKNEQAITVLEELVVLFKTSEILGQVLKEQYATIPRSTREPVVISLLDAYMRAAGAILRKVASDKALLHAWFVAELHENIAGLTDEEKTEKAQRFISDLVQMFMYAFFQKLGESITSDKTLDLIRNIHWPDSLESKLLILACELNLQRAVPFAKIDSLLEVAKKDTAFTALIRNLVQMRVSLFHTRGPDLQALAQRFNLNVSVLNAIDYRETRDR